MPHLTKTAPSGRDISARPALTYLLLYIFTLLVYMSMTPVIFTDVPYIPTAVGLYVNNYCDLYGRGTGLSQEPQLTN